MSDRSKNPRRRKVPGTFRTHERKGPDPSSEAQRIVLYLPITALDQAEQQAFRSKVDTVQRYCEGLLLRAINAEQIQATEQTITTHRERLEELRTIADDPDYLAEWTAAVLDQVKRPNSPEPLGHPSPVGNQPISPPCPETIVEQPAAEVVLRHAGLLGDDPEAFLCSLRQRATVGHGVGPELMQALIDLEIQHQGSRILDRRLSYALHKLAFEGQILVSEGISGSTVDDATVNLLRLIQEAVDRVLSGQDIRYYSSHDRNAPIDG